MRTASLPVGSALVKEAGEKRPVSAHSILNSVTRHSSLKTKVHTRACRAVPELSHQLSNHDANAEHSGHAGGESTVTQGHASGTLQELQQPQTAGPRGLFSGGAQLAGADQKTISENVDFHL